MGISLQKSYNSREKELFKNFYDIFWEKTPILDQEHYGKAYLLKTAEEAFDFFKKRNTEKPSLKIYSQQGFEGEKKFKEICTALLILNDDKPFLIDSTLAELQEKNLSVKLIVYPLFWVKRDEQGFLMGLFKEAIDSDCNAESLIFIKLNEEISKKCSLDIQKALQLIYEDVSVSVSDWSLMQAEMAGLEFRLKESPHDFSHQDSSEIKIFFEWLLADHFTFLGFRSYYLKDEEPIFEKGLGILRNPQKRFFEGEGDFLSPSCALQKSPQLSGLLIITKSSVKSHVHRAVPMDVIRLMRLDDHGEVVGEYQFFGLFTSAAYSQSIKDIPLLRLKSMHILQNAGFEASSHDGKALMHIMESLPRDIFFQMSAGELLEIVRSVFHLQTSERQALFVRPDPFNHLVSCLLYVPKDKYSTRFLEKIKKILGAAFDGNLMGWQSLLGDLAYARVNFIYSIPMGRLKPYNVKDLEEKIVYAAKSWTDLMDEFLIKECGEIKARTFFDRYVEAFPTSYQERFSEHEIFEDINHIEAAYGNGSSGGLTIRFDEKHSKGELQIKLYNPKNSLILSDVMPVFERLGLKIISENAFRLELSGIGCLWIHSFDATTSQPLAFNIHGLKPLFEEAFLKIWSGIYENDAFNKLVLGAALSIRKINLFRAFSRYLWQVHFPYSGDYIAKVLTKYPVLSQNLEELFFVRFDPTLDYTKEHRHTMFDVLKRTFLNVVTDIKNLEEDRILRRLLNCIEAVQRTNYFQNKESISFKLDPSLIPEMPKPCPKWEIFVYAVSMEGTHIRGGAIARGGIRFSDRREDFRTEILELFKTQTVKNSVIVPVGAKGGFVLKTKNITQAEVIGAYTLFIESLLDITDNIKEGKVITPTQMIRYDDDDPYLVVAADKGTSTFSDTANGIAGRYDFWLGDAFASGGSHGYDHKKMGITARGAWISVEGHFWEYEVDLREKEIRVIGIGDMGGDVFGNGMLMSQKLKLIGAFNHRHIFLDPNPDPIKSYHERKRLFNLPQSSWADYNSSLISEGGGVFDRSLKSISLSPEVRLMLGINDKSLEPDHLIRALLKAESDLLWLGGIGTYVKASFESHGDVEDRPNDSVRINANDLRCTVVGEGANLGFTQNARVQYALKGGRINTDSIDNSAGVDCSDHEVNLKILMGLLIQKGHMKEEERNSLLQKMTEDVVALVLKDNKLQTRAISVGESYGVLGLDPYARVIQRLEKEGRLNRELECLPSDKILAERRIEGHGLTRPELAILMSYCKVQLKEALIESSLLEEEKFAPITISYFPKILFDRVQKVIEDHPLRREILSLCLANFIISYAGITFVFEIMERTGLSISETVQVILTVVRLFSVNALIEDIEKCEHQIPEKLEIKLYIEIISFLRRTTLWFIGKDRKKTDFQKLSNLIQEFLMFILNSAKKSDSFEGEQGCSSFEKEGLNIGFFHKFDSLCLLGSSCNVIDVAYHSHMALSVIMPLYFEIGERFGLNWLRSEMEKTQISSYWDKLALGGVSGDLFLMQAQLTECVLNFGKKSGILSSNTYVNHAFLDQWIHERKDKKDRLDQIYNDFKIKGSIDLAMVLIASRHLQQFLM